MGKSTRHSGHRPTLVRLGHVEVFDDVGPVFGECFIEAVDVAAIIASATDQREDAGAVEDVEVHGLFRALGRASWVRVGCRRHGEILRERRDTHPPKPPAGGKLRGNQATDSTCSDSAAFAPRCCPCRYSTALEAIDAAVKIARLSFRSTFSQLAM